MLNILVLGERGVGKTSFVNTIASCVPGVVNGKIDFPAPFPDDAVLQSENGSNFSETSSVTSKDPDEQVAEESSDTIAVFSGDTEENEESKDAKPSLATYSISWGNCVVNVIDTPCMFDIAVKDIVDYCAMLDSLHAVCVCVRADTDIDPRFSNFIGQLLTAVGKAQASSIQFIVTHARPSNFEMTLEMQQDLRSSIKDIECDHGQLIPLRWEKDDLQRNVFYVDNERAEIMKVGAKEVDGMKTTQTEVTALITGLIKARDEAAAEAARLITLEAERQAAEEAKKQPTRHMDDSKCINILLLGETGVGKSTFINSFINYLLFKSFDDALDAADLPCLIPAKFMVEMDDGSNEMVTFGSDSNEDGNMGNSSTQGAKAYTFPLENTEHHVRIIDTPGIGDARGTLRDRENFENILQFIGQYKHIHGICFLLKPNVTVINPYFKFCIIELLSRLDKSAAANIIFLFTNTRGTNFAAPDTLTNVRRIVQEIEKKEKVRIPVKYNKKNAHGNNVFCFDNEGFKHLLALKQGVEFGDAAMMLKSWDISQQRSLELMRYIMGHMEHEGLTPHQVQDTVSLNEAQRLIVELSQPLVEISDNVQDNLLVLDRRKARLLQEDISKQELLDILYVPAVDVQCKEMPKPATICTSRDCSERVVISGLSKYHYKQRCHDPCHLRNVPREIIGSIELLDCWAMSGTRNCSQCGCDFSTHMHIYYQTETIETRVVDDSVQTQLNSHEQMIDALYKTVQNLEKRADSFRQEYDIISQWLAKFAYFIRKNSICPVNEAYEEYLEYLIKREQNSYDGDAELLERYTAMKKEHIEHKRLLENASKIQVGKPGPVTSADIVNALPELYALKLTGKRIQELHKGFNAAVRSELSQHNQYIDMKSLKQQYDRKRKARQGHQQKQDAPQIKIPPSLPSLPSLPMASNKDIESICQLINAKSIDDLVTIIVKMKFAQFQGTSPTMEGDQSSMLQLISALMGAQQPQAPLQQRAASQWQLVEEPRQERYPHAEYQTSNDFDESKNFIAPRNGNVGYNNSYVERESYGPFNFALNDVNGDGMVKRDYGNVTPGIQGTLFDLPNNDNRAFGELYASMDREENRAYLQQQRQQVTEMPQEEDRWQREKALQENASGENVNIDGMARREYDNVTPGRQGTPYNHPNNDNRGFGEPYAMDRQELEKKRAYLQQQRQHINENLQEEARWQREKALQENACGENVNIDGMARREYGNVTPERQGTPYNHPSNDNRGFGEPYAMDRQELEKKRAYLKQQRQYVSEKLQEEARWQREKALQEKALREQALREHVLREQERIYQDIQRNAKPYEKKYKSSGGDSGHNRKDQNAGKSWFPFFR